MDEYIIALHNQSKTVTSAEEAIDFNFNASVDSVDQDSIGDWGIPFVHNLNRPFLPGDLILFEGRVLKYAVCFRIDFCTNENDLVLHINPRMDQNYIARNSYIEDKWGEEEGVAITKSPIMRGKPFQIQVFVLEKEYMVCVNGIHMFNYSHRLSPIDISKIEAYGDIELSNVALLRSNVYPHPFRDKYKKPENSLDVPFTRFIKHGLGTFGKILITGRAKLLPVSFFINVQSSDVVYPHPKIVYHLNVRYSSESYVVQNSWGMKGESWDEEIRSPMPLALSPGSVFKLSIITTNAYIQASGPDWDLPLFHHRLNPDQGLYVYIQGDIILSGLKVFPDNDSVSVF